MFRHWLRQLFPHRFRSGRRSARRAFHRPILDILEGRLAPATCVFNYSMSSAWEDAANWTGCNGGLPGSGDVAQIGNPGHDATVTLSSSQTISRLMATGDTHFSTSLAVNSGGNLTANSWQVSTDFTLNLTGGTLTVNPTGSYTLTSSTFNYNSGTIAVNPMGAFPAINLISSTLNIGPTAASAATFLVQGSGNQLAGTVHHGQVVRVQGNTTHLNAVLAIGGTVTNQGAIQYEGQSTCCTTYTGQVQVAAGGSLVNDTQGQILATYTTSPLTGSVVNKGLIQVTSPYHLQITSGTFEEAGGDIMGDGYLYREMLRVTSSPAMGTPIQIRGPANQLLSNNLPGTTLAVQGSITDITAADATLTLVPNTSNQGVIQLTGTSTCCTTYVSHLVFPTGGTASNDGQIQVSTVGTHTITGDPINRGPISVSGSAALIITGGVYHEDGGTIQGNAWLEGEQIAETSSPLGGTSITLRRTNTLLGDNLPGITLVVQGSSTLGVSALLLASSGAVNGGTIQLMGQSTCCATYIGQLQVPAGGGGLINTGTIQISGPGTQTVTVDQFDNQGTIQVGGAVSFNGSVLNDAAGGLITGSGTLSFPGTSTLQNEGTVAVAQGQTLDITGSFLNLQNQTLLDGMYQVAGTLGLLNVNIATLAAAVELDGTGVIKNSGAHNVDLLAGLSLITEQGSLTVAQNRVFSQAVNLTNNGSVLVGLNSAFTVTAGHSYTQGPAALLTVDRGQFKVLGTFTNFDPNQQTLTGGTYHLISDMTVAGILQFPMAAIQTNAATIILDGPTPPTAPYSIVDPTGADALAQLSSNQGSLTITGGRNLTLPGFLDNPGTLVADTGSTVLIGELSNEGTVAVNAGGILQITTLDNYDPPTNTLNGGTWTVSGTLQFPGADIQTNAANLTLDASTGRIIDENSNSGLLHFQNNNGSFTLFGDDPANPVTLTLNGLNFTDNGTLTVGPAAIFRIAGANSSYTENGTVMIQDTGTLRVDTTLTNYDPMTNTLSGGVFWIAGTLKLNHPDIQTNDTTLILYGSDWMVVDLLDNDVGLANLATNDTNGVLQIVDGAFDDMSPFTNAGQVVVDASKVGVYGDYTQLSGASTTLLNGSLIDLIIDPDTYTFYNNAGATLSGTGYILGNVVNGGQIVIGDATTTAVLTVENGNFTQTATGVLVVKLGGATPDAGEFDQLCVSGGNITLDGILKVVTLDDFSTDVGYMYPVVKCDGTMTVMDTFMLMAPDLGGLRLDLAPPDGQTLTLITVN